MLERFLIAQRIAHARTGNPSASGVDTSMKTFHGWLRERHKQQEGMSPANPLPKDSEVNKSLKQNPKALPSGVPTFKPWKPCSTGTVCEDRNAEPNAMS